MSGIKEYKCEQCGGRMEFDSQTQNMKCPYCGCEMTVEEFTEQEGKDNQNQEGNTWIEGETDGIYIYICESCGGEIIAEETTGASTCPYCDNRVVMKGQFQGDLKPDYVIPFKLDKKAAKEAYLQHLKGKIFLPRVFRRENHIDEIKGIYVPFWLFDVNVDADLEFNSERLTVYTSGDTEYTDHECFRVIRKGEISFDKIPEDGSEKMDDALMESVEPYDFNEAVPFNSAYLSGYMADRYDVSSEERKQRAKERAEQSTKDSFKETVTGYDMVDEGNGIINIKGIESLYALYPVWILNTTWRNEKYVFAMNGQSGKIVGNLPLDKSLIAKYVGIRGPILGVIAYGIMQLINLL